MSFVLALLTIQLMFGIALNSLSAIFVNPLVIDVPEMALSSAFARRVLEFMEYLLDSNWLYLKILQTSSLFSALYSMNVG